MSARIRIASGVRWSGPVIAGVIAVIVVAGVAFAGAVRIVGALLTPAADPEAGKAFDQLLAKHEDALLASRKRFDGRSAFFMPPRPVPPAPPPSVAPPPPPDPGPPPPPPPPPEYSGPKVIACLGSSVFFADGSRVSVDEERGGVRVVSTNPPWTVTLHHHGRDYTVSTVPDSTESFINGSLAAFGTSMPGMTPVERAPAAATPLAPVAVPTRGGASSPPAAAPDSPGVDDPSAVPPDAPNAEPPSTTPPDSPATVVPAATEPTASPAPEPAPSTEPPSAASAHSVTIPPALTKAQIDQMSGQDASKALMAVGRARLSRSLDEATRSRLNQEYSWLQARVRATSTR